MSNLSLSALPEQINGVQHKASKARKPALPVLGRAQARERYARRKAQEWAGRYTGVAIVLSAGLNGFAAVCDSGAVHPLAISTAATIGAVVPGLVWGLGKLAGWLHRARWSRLAATAGAVGVCLLLLSVIHCSASIAGLTGSSLVLSTLLAIGIDCGLVVSELAAILVSEDE